MSRVPLRNSVRSVLVAIPRHSTYIELLGVVSRENQEYVDQRGCRTGGSGFSQRPPRTPEPNVQDLVCRADAGVAAAGYWGSHKISKAMIEMLRTDAELEGLFSGARINRLDMRRYERCSVKHRETTRSRRRAR